MQKKDRTTLNKVTKVIEDARKAYKARCLAPYDALEPDMKSLVDIVEKQRALIDNKVPVETEYVAFIGQFIL